MRYDLVVIGGGSGGLTAADFSARLGASVVLVEQAKLGGDCTWSGCVPSKALLYLGRLVHHARLSEPFGVNPTPPVQTDMKTVRAYLQDVIQDIYQHETPQRMAEKGVKLLLGAARFVDAHTISVNDKIIEAKNVLITTGARPLLPSLPGLDSVPYHTYETFFDNDTLPKHLVVLGAGATGLELGQAYRRLGSRVTLVDGVAPLIAWGTKASETIQAVLADEGIAVVHDFAKAVRQVGKEIVVETADKQVRGDMLLVATGRRPTVQGLELEKAGVRYSETGIGVNDRLQTSVSHIYAAGDCTGGPQLTHYAGWQAFQAARNALLPGSDKGVRPGVVCTVFTDPEVAHAGYTLKEARDKYGEDAVVSSRPLSRVDRAVTERAEAGFIDMVHLQNGRLLGATIIAPRAGELINEFALALQHSLSIRDLASTIHAYPSYGMGIQRLAADLATERFLNGTTGKIIKKISGF